MNRATHYFHQITSSVLNKVRNIIFRKLNYLLVSGKVNTAKYIKCDN